MKYLKLIKPRVKFVICVRIMTVGKNGNRKVYIIKINVFSAVRKTVWNLKKDFGYGIYFIVFPIPRQKK